MTRTAILSDLHGNIPAIERVIEDMQKRQVDRVFCLGDLISGPLWPKETLALLMQQNWIFIRGNHDTWLVERNFDQLGPTDQYAQPLLNREELDWLASLPETRLVDGTFLLCHGSPRQNNAYLLDTIEHGRIRLSTPQEIKSKIGPECAPVILCGHSHYPRVVKVGAQLFVNPGSVGLPAYDDEDEEHGYFVVETGSSHSRYAILEEDEQGWKAEIVLLSYDHETAAKQAHKNNRPDIEIGLRTGFMHPM